MGEFKWFTDLWPTILANLKRRPEATLAVAILLVGFVLHQTGAHPTLVIGLPIAIYVLYHLRMRSAERHKERLAELNVQKTEISLGRSVKEKARKALERRKPDASN